MISQLCWLLMHFLPSEWRIELKYQQTQWLEEGFSKASINRLTLGAIWELFQAWGQMMPAWITGFLQQVDPSFVNDHYLIGNPNALENIEQEFLQDYYVGSINTMKAAGLYAFVCYAAFGILDYWCLSSALVLSWSIRFVVCALCLGLLGATYSQPAFFQKWHQFMVSALVTVAGSGLIAMIAISQPKEIAYLGYYGGILLVLLFAYTFCKLRFFYATASGTLLVIAYNLMAIFVQELHQGTATDISLFLNTNFMLISANVVGALTCNYYERTARIEFLMRFVVTNKLLELYRYYENIYPTPQELLQKINSIRHSPQQFRKFMIEALTNTPDEGFGKLTGGMH